MTVTAATLKLMKEESNVPGGNQGNTICCFNGFNPKGPD